MANYIGTSPQKIKAVYFILCLLQFNVNVVNAAFVVGRPARVTFTSRLINSVGTELILRQLTPMSSTVLRVPVSKLDTVEHLTLI